MTKAKTAISIENALLIETDKVARELAIPRSQIISKALSEYLQEHRNRQLLARINEACSGEPDADDIEAMKIIRAHQKQQEQNEEWK